jgi:hypothetical protein
MLPMRAVRLALGDLLAADAATLAPPVNKNAVALIVANFALTENLVATDLTLASTHGLAPLDVAAGAQAVALDPVDGAQVITLIPFVAGGFRWVSSGVFPPTIMVYGAALLDSTLATLLAAMVLPSPIAIADVGYQIDLDPLTMKMTLVPIS